MAGPYGTSFDAEIKKWKREIRWEITVEIEKQITSNKRTNEQFSTETWKLTCISQIDQSQGPINYIRLQWGIRKS
jgi:hypothetical protein